MFLDLPFLSLPESSKLSAEEDGTGCVTAVTAEDCWEGGGMNNESSISNFASSAWVKRRTSGPSKAAAEEEVDDDAMVYLFVSSQEVEYWFVVWTLL